VTYLMWDSAEPNLAVIRARASTDPLRGLGLVVVDGVPFLALRPILVAALVGDFSLGLLKQTLYMVAIALVTDELCRTDEAASYKTPPAFRVIEIAFAVLIVLVLLRIATRQIRRALERAEQETEVSLPIVGHASPGEPLSAEDEAARARARKRASAQAHRSMAFVALRLLVALGVLAVLYLEVIGPLLRTVGVRVVATLLGLIAKPGLLIGLIIALQPANYVVPMGGGTISRILIVCLLAHVPTVPLRAIAAACCFVVAKSVSYLIVPPVYLVVHIPILRAFQAAPVPFSDLAKPFILFIDLAHAFLLSADTGATDTGAAVTGAADTSAAYTGAADTRGAGNGTAPVSPEPNQAANERGTDGNRVAERPGDLEATPRPFSRQSSKSRVSSARGYGCLDRERPDPIRKTSASSTRPAMITTEDTPAPSPRAGSEGSAGSAGSRENSAGSVSSADSAGRVAPRGGGSGDGVGGFVPKHGPGGGGSSWAADIVWLLRWANVLRPVRDRFAGNLLEPGPWSCLIPRWRGINQLDFYS